MKNTTPKETTDIQSAYYPSPLGIIQICGTDESITSVLFLDSDHTESSPPNPLLENCMQQLDEYFHHQRLDFDLPLDPQGTAFQRHVWEKLLEIPYSTTTSYHEIARRLGNQKAIRAVGGANGRNPIVIIIPCHRVIGANEKLIGYGGGLWRKEWLLKHEKNVLV